MVFTKDRGTEENVTGRSFEAGKNLKYLENEISEDGKIDGELTKHFKKGVNVYPKQSSTCYGTNKYQRGSNWFGQDILPAVLYGAKMGEGMNRANYKQVR